MILLGLVNTTRWRHQRSFLRFSNPQQSPGLGSTKMCISKLKLFEQNGCNPSNIYSTRRHIDYDMLCTIVVRFSRPPSEPMTAASAETSPGYKCSHHFTQRG
jgi:hypothetical protein